MDDGLLFRVITGQANEIIRVCRLPTSHQKILGADTCAVWLSPETCRKTESKHRHPEMDLYRRAPAIIQSGIPRVIDERRMLYMHEFSDQPGKFYRAVVKRTIDRREVYLISVSRMRPKQWRKILESTQAI